MTNLINLHSFIGLTILQQEVTGHKVRLHLVSGMQRLEGQFFRATMPLIALHTFSIMIRFDNHESRPARRVTDKLASHLKYNRPSFRFQYRKNATHDRNGRTCLQLQKVKIKLPMVVRRARGMSPFSDCVEISVAWKTNMQEQYEQWMITQLRTQFMKAHLHKRNRLKKKHFGGSASSVLSRVQRIS